MLERIRKDDFVYAYYLIKDQQGQTINCAWVIERGGQLFVFTIMGMVQQTVRCFLADVERLQFEGVRTTLNMLGFIEIPVFTKYSQMNKDAEAELESAFKIFDTNLQKKQEEQLKAIQEAQKAQEAKEVQEGAKPDLKLADGKK